MCAAHVHVSVYDKFLKGVDDMRRLRFEAHAVASWSQGPCRSCGRFWSTPKIHHAGLRKRAEAGLPVP